MLEVALILYALGVAYGLFFVGLPILFAGSDCDHAFLLLLPYCVVLPFVWPLVLIWGALMHLRAALAAGSRRAKTAKPVECEASQSGDAKQRNAQSEPSS